MKKPASLRAAIAALLPDIARDPDKLAMWVERGRVRAPQTVQRGFAWEYELTLVAEDYTHDPAVIFFLVVEWLRDNQPDLLAANTDGFAFEVDVIDDKTFDVKITLPLREIVTAQQLAEGWQLEVLAEPVPHFPDAVPLRGNQGPITSIWVQSDEGTFQVAPDE
ncbi:phage tail protein [Novosphingobium sp. KN65.2]|uniref:phage tail protein n=1 Tax=Novosphingobium sp. KN65.2 TaxID=1478134 RepID=UPI0005E9A7B3|nr:phage tail protein [Novosphingobium sp. KN65.2]CDO35833.1 Bacteriophage P2 Tail completion protein GPR [Novosphingobium sp. KN65.2]